MAPDRAFQKRDDPCPINLQFAGDGAGIVFNVVLLRQGSPGHKRNIRLAPSCQLFQNAFLIFKDGEISCHNQNILRAAGPHVLRHLFQLACIPARKEQLSLFRRI